MRIGIARALLVALAGLWLGGCSASGNFANPFESKRSDAQAHAPASAYAPPNDDNVATGSIPAALGAQAPADQASDEVGLGKQAYRANNFILSETHFRRATEVEPRHLEAWLGLAATYDRLRRFDLADHAYERSIAIGGATPAILNNQGYSYMLRGDPKQAQAKLMEAKRKDPRNGYVLSNLQMLEEGRRKGKPVQ